MTASTPNHESNGWFIQDATMYHPDYFPDEAGASLQEIRDYYLWHQRSDLNPSVTAAPWYLEPPDDAISDLCNVCRYINFQWLFRNHIHSDFGPILFLRHMLENQSSCSFCRIAVAALRTADGQDLSVEDLQDDENVLGCWITSRKPSSEPNGPAIVSIWRRKLFVTGGFVGQAGFVQEIGSADDGCLGRRISSHTDLDLVKSWLTICEERHQDIAGQARLLDPITDVSAPDLQLRLIDVRRRCIVTGIHDTRYVALSYVWGKVDQLKLLISNLDLLGTKGILSHEKLGVRLPRTISDAIELTAAIGEEYLWVDALCLIQDGPDFVAQVQNMDVVYGKAAWTLVAASADNANTPLPRTKKLDEHLEVPQYTELVGNMSIGVVLPSLQALLQTSIWDQRAWTYQESTLSRRLLVVSNPQMYFTCRHGYTYYEDTRVENMPPFQIDRSGQVFGSAIGVATNFEVYADAVTEYTSRQMSFQADGLNAISGVLSQFRTWFRGDFLSGLPSTELDQALLWYPKGDMIRRKDLSGDDLFPSWSWAGWMGQSVYWSGLALSCVKWKDANLSPTTYWTSDELRRPPYIPKDNSERAWPGWKEKRDTYLEDHLASLETYDSCWFEETDPQTLYLHPVAIQSERIDHPASTWQDGYLQFRAMTCFLDITGSHGTANARLGLPCSSDNHKLCALNVYNKASQLCGTVHVPASVSSTLAPGTYEFVRLSRTHLSSDGTRSTKLACDWEQAIYTSAGAPENCQNTDDDDDNDIDDDESLEGNEFGVDDGCTFDTDVFDIDEIWCVYNVLLVETLHGVSRRIGLGKVHIAAFCEEENPEWRDIILA